MHRVGKLFMHRARKIVYAHSRKSKIVYAQSRISKIVYAQSRKSKSFFSKTFRNEEAYKFCQNWNFEMFALQPTSLLKNKD